MKYIVLFMLLFSFISQAEAYEFHVNTKWKYNFLNDLELSRPSWYTIPNTIFYPQAPLETKDNWYIHYESCEEASIFLAHFNINSTKFDREYMNTQINNMNNYQEKIWIPVNKIHIPDTGRLYLRDITIPEINHYLAKGYYGYNEENSHIINNPNIELLEYLISKNYIIIIPTHTDFLKNPRMNWDTYHVIDLIWYDRDNFISLEVGTGIWNKYKYDKLDIISGIRSNWNEILILEWNINRWNIWFDRLYKKAKDNYLKNREYQIFSLKLDIYARNKWLKNESYKDFLTILEIKANEYILDNTPEFDINILKKLVAYIWIKRKQISKEIVLSKNDVKRL